MSKLLSSVVQECERLAVPLEHEQQRTLAAYFELLARWGKRIRLTGTIEPRQLVERHLGDALVVHSLLPGCSERLLDVGSGGGLPALPLCVLRHKLCATLIEANGRKATFLRTAAHELAMVKRVTVLDQRFEAVELAPTFDVVSSRATFAPSEWLERARPHLAEHGRLLVYLGRQESAPPQQLATRLGLVVDQRRDYCLQDGTPRLLLSYRRGLAPSQS